MPYPHELEPAVAGLTDFTIRLCGLLIEKGVLSEQDIDTLLTRSEGGLRRQGGLGEAASDYVREAIRTGLTKGPRP